MLHSLWEHPAVVQTLDEASDELHRDVRELDSEDALRSTVAVQSALLTAGVAAARALVHEGIRPLAVAGLSVGAFGAAVICGVLSFRQALQLVTQRAQLMEGRFPEGFGLSAIVGLSEQQVATLVNRYHSAENPVYLGNINAPRQIVIAGSNAGMAKVLDQAVRNGAQKAERLKVPVPSHCPLLQPVADSLRQILSKLPLSQPKVVYVSNVRARALRRAEDIAKDLSDNIAHGVRWHDAVTVLSELGCTTFWEMPPGHTLTNLARQAFPECECLSSESVTPDYIRHFAANDLDSSPADFPPSRS